MDKYKYRNDVINILYLLITIEVAKLIILFSIFIAYVICDTESEVQE